MIKLRKEALVHNFLNEEKKKEKDINDKLIKDGALEPLEHEHVENNPESVEKHIEAAKKHAEKEIDKSKEVAKKIAVDQKAVLFSESLKFKDRASLTEFLLKLREQKIRRRVVPLHEDAEGYKFEVRYEKLLKEEDRPAPKSIEDCQKWIDYDMKHYGKISDNTNDIIKKAGYQIIKDDHGDYEVTAGKYEDLKEDNNNESEYNYWFELVKDYLNNRLEDRTSDERLVKATDKDIDDIVNRVVNKILNDDEVWSVIDSAIEYDILHDEFLVDADMKDEDVKEETKFNNLNEAWDFSDEDERASRIFAKDLEENSNADDVDDNKLLKEKVEKRIIKKQTTNSMWDFGDEE